MEQAITETPDDLEDVCQAETENDTAFAARLHNAAYRCGNVHEEDRKINLYINGLLPVLTTIVQRFQNATPRSELSMERIAQFSIEEGDLYRSRLSGNGSRQQTS